MSEKEIIFNIKNAIEEAKKKYNDTYDVSMTLYSNKLIEGLLDLYNKEKDKNASLQKEIKLMKSININDNYISKDKIKEHLKKFDEIEKEFIFIDNKSTAREIYKALIEFSKRLLEE